MDSKLHFFIFAELWLKLVLFSEYCMLYTYQINSIGVFDLSIQWGIGS